MRSGDVFAMDTLSVEFDEEPSNVVPIKQAVAKPLEQPEQLELVAMPKK